MADERRPARRTGVPPDGRTGRTAADQASQPFVNGLIPAGHRLRKPTSEEMTHYRNALAGARRDASAVFARRITASRAFLADVEAGLPSLASLPTLIVWGNADIAFGDKERQRWEQIFTEHHSVIVEGAGHFVQSDAPDRFAATIRDWRSAFSAARRPETM
jgi:haloalkane dehalogenase